jgi:hypothetical protein
MEEVASLGIKPVDARPSPSPTRLIFEPLHKGKWRDQQVIPAVLLIERITQKIDRSFIHKVLRGGQSRQTASLGKSHFKRC